MLLGGLVRSSVKTVVLLANYPIIEIRMDTVISIIAHKKHCDNFYQ